MKDVNIDFIGTWIRPSWMASSQAEKAALLAVRGLPELVGRFSPAPQPKNQQPDGDADANHQHCSWHSMAQSLGFRWNTISLISLKVWRCLKHYTDVPWVRGFVTGIRYTSGWYVKAKPRCVKQIHQQHTATLKIRQINRYNMNQYDEIR